MCYYSILGSFYGIGARPEDLDQGKLLRGVQYGLRGEIFYIFSIAIVKTSVGLGVLRIAIERRYRRIIMSIIFSATGFYVGSLICVFMLCTSLWKTQLVATCTDTSFPYAMVWLGMSIAALTDAAFAIVPIILVRRLHLPRRTKYALMVVFALGSLGAVASVARFPFVNAWVKLSPDHPEAFCKFACPSTSQDTSTCAPHTL